MGKIIVFMNLTLDGVIQGPASPDEDRRDGFEKGGWAAPYNAMQNSEAGQFMSNIGGLLMGRRTYENFYDFWPKQTNNPFTDRLNAMQKYVASTTLKEPLEWVNSTLLKGDLSKAINELKARDKDIMIMGSGDLIQSLMKHNLVDLYVLMIHPLVLAQGHKLFKDGGAFATLKLIDAKPTPTGVIVATYEPAGSSSANPAN